MTNIIVGSGISGLLLGYRLLKKGEEVIIIEKSKDVGGLLSTTTIEGIETEKFYHHIFKTDTKAIKLIKELGLSKKLKWCESSMSIYYDGKFRSFRSPIDLIKFSPISFIDRIKTGLVTLYLQKSNNWHELENYPAWKWLRKYGGKSAYKVIWEPLLVSKFGDKYKKVSMAWMWARVHLRGKSTEKGTEKLGYVVGSFGQINKILVKKIKKMGGKILTGADVRGVERKNDKLIVNVGDKKIICEKVFLCLANDQAAKIVKDKKISKKLNKVEYVGVVNVIFSTKKDLTDYYWNNINEKESPFVAFVKQSQLVGKYNNKHVYYLGAYVDTKSNIYQKSDKEIGKIFVDYLKTICLGFNNKDIDEMKVFKFDRAQQITTCDYKDKIVGFNLGIENVYLVNFSQIYPWDRGINWAIDKIDELLSWFDGS